MCPDNNVLWKCVCTMSLTKARLLTCTQSAAALEQRFNTWTSQFKQQQNVTGSALDKIISPNRLHMGEKKGLLKTIYFEPIKASNMCWDLWLSSHNFMCFQYILGQVAHEWSFQSLSRVTMLCCATIKGFLGGLWGFTEYSFMVSAHRTKQTIF